ncbi:DUF4376 domain-containing protein [Sulfuritortus calidifontis]|uniref:DUF4376 domain-containing protein n=1 Tax=Sulfuritortus calidifontis TaxID=1914471 RepID=UPI000F84A133|nr:DUF4376 domain-containing protein [Sulfuritortus calidifontis]
MIYYAFNPITRRYSGETESEGCPTFATATAPHRPDAVYDVIHRVWVDPPDTTPSIAEVKAAKKLQIEAERDAQCVANVTVNGHVWQADKRSQELLGQAISLAQAGLPLPSVWRDADNNDVPVTSIADLLAIAGVIAQQVQTAYSTSWARKAALEAATTIEEVNAV